MSCITSCFRSTSTQCSEDASSCMGRTWGCLTKGAHAAERGASAVGRGFRSGGSAVAASAKHTSGYIQRNWVRLTAITLAWAVIIAGTGILYGFQSGSLLSGLEFTAKPLAIGFAAGFGFGVLTGILTKLKLDPDNKRDNTIAEVIINQWIGKLGLTTQFFIITITISIALAAIPALPTPMGIVFGVMVGNYLSTKFALNADLGDPNGAPKDVKAEAAALRSQLERLAAQITALEAQGDGN